MLSRFYITALALILSTVALAQTSTPQLFEEARAKIVRTIGAAPSAVEIGQTGSVITVLRINSGLNKGTHAGRDNEASTIAPIIADAVTGKPEFKDLTTIRVQYVTRSAPGGTSKIIDTVDFRKTPGGTFEFHRT
jgi:hypothetical protein